MDSATALLVLKRVLRHLPTGVQWQLNPKTADDLAVAKAFNLPIAIVNPLLILSGVRKVTAQGFGIVKSGLEALCNNSDGCLSVLSIRTVRYVANVIEPPLYPNPAKQAKNKLRCPPQVKLPKELLTRMKIAAQVFVSIDN